MFKNTKHDEEREKQNKEKSDDTVINSGKFFLKKEGKGPLLKGKEKTNTKK